MPDRPPPFPLLTGPGGLKSLRWGDPRLGYALERELGRPVELVRDLELTRGVIIAADAARERARGGRDQRPAQARAPPAGGWSGRELAFRDGVRLRLVASRADGPGIEARVVEAGRLAARRAGHAELGFSDHTNLKEDRTAVLRIDETSGTLVAPQASGLVQESPPDREELLGLVTVLVGRLRRRARPVGRAAALARARPYVDLLGLDEARTASS